MLNRQQSSLAAGTEATHVTALGAALLKEAGEVATLEVISVQLELLDLVQTVYNVYKGTTDTLEAEMLLPFCHPRQCVWWVETSSPTTLCCSKSRRWRTPNIGLLSKGELTHTRCWTFH